MKVQKGQKIKTVHLSEVILRLNSTFCLLALAEFLTAIHCE